MTKSATNQNSNERIQDTRTPDANSKTVDAGEYGQLNLPQKENNTTNNQERGNNF